MASIRKRGKLTEDVGEDLNVREKEGSETHSDKKGPLAHEYSTWRHLIPEAVLGKC